MKHVFCIHSPITYLMMRSIIEYKQIKTKDIIVFTRRGYTFNWSEIKSYPLNAPKFEGWNNENIFISIIKTCFFILRFLYWIINILKILGFRRCELYIPNSSILEWNLLSAPIFSNSFNYIEEGGQYYKKDWRYVKETKLPLKERFLYFGLLKYKGLFSNRVKDTFAFSHKIRNEIPGTKVILSLSDIIQKFKQQDNKKEIILAIDGGSTWQQAFTLEQHTSTIKLVLNEIKRKYGNIPFSFKFHPNQYNSEKEISTFRALIREFFPNAKELPPETILESYLGNKNKIIYAGDSSLSLYSFILGYPINSYILSYSNFNVNFTLENLRKKYPLFYIKYLAENQFNKIPSKKPDKLVNKN